MKKEIWFNKRNRVTARNLIAMYRGLGYTDEQIKAEMLKIKAAQQARALDAAIQPPAELFKTRILSPLANLILSRASKANR